jgi:hypothetical protein
MFFFEGQLREIDAAAEREGNASISQSLNREVRLNPDVTDL